MFTKNSSNVAKGIAIALLLFHHLFYSADRVATGGEYFALLPYPVVQLLALCARVCVYIFVFISAYGLSSQFGQSDSRYPMRFIVAHWISLMQSFWPVYLIVFFARALFVSPSPSGPLSVYGSNPLAMLLDFFGWSDLFGTHLILSVWWYMCFAQLLIICLPLIARLCRILRWYAVPLAAITSFAIPCAINSPYCGYYLMYAFSVILGVLFAQNQTFDRIYSALGKQTWVHRIGITAALLAASLALLIANQGLSAALDSWQVSGIINGLAATFICVLAGRVRGESIPGRMAAYCGAYSGAMFMFHPFLYSYTPKLVYWPGEAFLCYLVLFLISLVFSVLISLARKVCRYDLVFSMLRKAAERRIVA